MIMHHRGRIEILYAVVKECPQSVTRLLNLANLRYAYLGEVEKEGLIKVPRLGTGRHQQIVSLTEKGEEFKRAMRVVERILK